MTAQAGAQDWLASIRDRFLGRLKTQAEELDALADHLDRAEARTEAAFILHRIAGVAGTVGYVEFGRMAKDLEDLMKAANGSRRPLTDAECERFEDFLDLSQDILESQRQSAG